jgi:hypothetical protein
MVSQRGTPEHAASFWSLLKRACCCRRCTPSGQGKLHPGSPQRVSPPKRRRAPCAIGRDEAKSLSSSDQHEATRASFSTSSNLLKPSQTFISFWPSARECDANVNEKPRPAILSDPILDLPSRLHDTMPKQPTALYLRILDSRGRNSSNTRRIESTPPLPVDLAGILSMCVGSRCRIGCWLPPLPVVYVICPLFWLDGGLKEGPNLRKFRKCLNSPWSWRRTSNVGGDTSLIGTSPPHNGVYTVP